MANVEAHAKRGYNSIRRSGWIQPLTRIGFLCKGIVYILLGTMAIMYAFNAGGETTDQRGVIRVIAGQPLGTIALIIIVIGLLAYAGWRFICAFSDAERDGKDVKGLGARVGHFCSGAAHAGIAFYAIKLLSGGSASHADGTKSWTARLLQIPGGELLVGLGGLIVIGAGVFQIKKGLHEDFKDDLHTFRMGREEKRWVTRAGRWGHVARGVAFGLVGVFLLFAAFNSDPNEARGLEGVLDTVAAQPYGQWLLAVLAAGLALYGFYCITEAKYRRIRS
jgi:hypothetical protein